MPTMWVVMSTNGESAPAVPSHSPGHSLRRLSSKEVKMMISKVSCGFDICYVSSVVV